MQTATGWLIDKIVQDQMYKAISQKEWIGIFEQAKEMEKQQIIDAHGNKQKMNAGISTYKYTLTGEQYYNETYGK